MLDHFAAEHEVERIARERLGQALPVEVYDFEPGQVYAIVERCDVAAAVSVRGIHDLGEDGRAPATYVEHAQGPSSRLSVVAELVGEDCEPLTDVAYGGVNDVVELFGTAHVSLPRRRGGTHSTAATLA